MSEFSESSLPTDIRLLLRADAERCWLHREVIPVLRQVEEAERLADEEVGAALAYLEAMWSEATSRACATDAVHHHLCSHGGKPEALSGPASRYHAAVRALRGIVAGRVMPFVLDERRCEQGDGELHMTDARPGGCAPRAA